MNDIDYLKDIRQGARTIRGFVEKGPILKKTLDKPRDFDVALNIGILQSVMYQASNGIIYEHQFAKRSRPTLIVSADGLQLAIIGGRYRFTNRGITDF